MGHKHSKEVRAQYYQVLEETYRDYHISHNAHHYVIVVTSAILLVVGLLAVGLWSYMLNYNWEYKGSPIPSGAGIWTGALCLAVASLGIALSVKKSYALLNAQMWTNIGVSSGAYTQYMQLAFKAWDKCRFHNKENATTAAPLDPACMPDPQLMTSLGMANIACCSVMIASTVVIITYFSVAATRVNKKIKCVSSGWNSLGVENPAAEKF